MNIHHLSVFEVIQEFHRKNSTGQKVAFEVPEMIVLYNNNMHAVDVFDQIRKFFGVDLSHKIFEWTVRMMEILFSMILRQAYNVYRAIHKGNKDKQRSHTQFKVETIRGLLSQVMARHNMSQDIHGHCHTKT